MREDFRDRPKTKVVITNPDRNYTRVINIQYGVRDIAGLVQYLEGNNPRVRVEIIR